MYEPNKKVIIISIIAVIVLAFGGIFYFTKIRKNMTNRENNQQINEYVEDENMNLDEVVKKDKALIQTLMNTLPYVSGLHQSVYNEETVKIDNIKKELLFTKAYYLGVDKISKDSNEYNELVNKYNINLVDSFVKIDVIINKIKELYNIEINELPDEIELIGGNAKKYGEYYAIMFNSEPYGLGKYSKILSYDISDNTIIIYEKPVFYSYDGIEQTITFFNSDQAKNPILSIEGVEYSLDLIKNEFKSDSNNYIVYEHIFTKSNGKYYWYSTNSAKEDKE